MERISADQIRRRGSHTGSHSSHSSNQGGYCSSPSFQTGLVRRDSFEMSPHMMDSPRLQRTHSAVQHSESSHSAGLPTRSGSYRYPEPKYREPSMNMYARDDSYLYGAPGFQRGVYHRGSGSGSDKEYMYGSHSETYTPPVRPEQFSPQSLHSRENSFHDSVHSHESSLQDHHEHLYSPVSVQSSHSSNNRQEELYSPVLNMSRPEHERRGFSPINAGTPTPTREMQTERMYSPVIPSSHEDQCLAFSQDILCQQQGGHASPSPSKPKLRFPRTNPTYIGVNKRDGSAGYKKINVDQSSHLSDSGASDGQPVNTSAMQTSQIHPEYFDNSFLRRERSDSEASYSSNRVYRMEHKDSHTSPSSLRLRDRELDRDLSDSQSSQGSVRNMSDVQSEGSLRNMQDSAVSFQDSISSRGSTKSFGADRDVKDRNKDNQFSHVSNNQYLQDTSKDSNDDESEPEYANIPPPPPMKIEEISDTKVTDFSPQIPKFHLNDENNLKNVLKERNSNIEISEFSDDLRNGDGVTLELLREVNGSGEEGYDDESDDQVIDLMQSSQMSEGKYRS